MHNNMNLSRNGAVLCKNVISLKFSICCRLEGSHAKAEHEYNMHTTMQAASEPNVQTKPTHI